MEGNYHKAINGRIWIIWDPNIYEVECIREEAQFLYCHVKERQGLLDRLISVVYGYNTNNHCIPLWEGLQKVSVEINLL